MMPSPHTGAHTLGVEIEPPVQPYPIAGPVQSALHPIPSVLPSSHTSPSTFLPSPQIEVQKVLSNGSVGNSSTVLQFHPTSKVHESEHPSKLIKPVS